MFFIKLTIGPPMEELTAVAEPVSRQLVSCESSAKWLSNMHISTEWITAQAFIGDINKGLCTGPWGHNYTYIQKCFDFIYIYKPSYLNKIQIRSTHITTQLAIQTSEPTSLALEWSNKSQYLHPDKHVIVGHHYWADTAPMLPASGPCWPSSDPRGLFY